MLTYFFSLAPNPEHGRAASTSRFPPLSEIRPLIINHLINELTKYFPEGTMAMFDALNPTQLPVDSSLVFGYSNNRIQNLAGRFGLDEEIITNEFGILLHSLLDDHAPDYCTHREKDSPVNFWSYFLNSPTVIWHPSIKKLVQIVLVIPIASADVERGFSILAHTRSDRRSRLTAAHLQNILFLRINGPPLEKLDAARYAQAWIEAGVMQTDDPTQIRKVQKNELVKSNLF